MKRGIACREARTTHSRRGVLTEGREKGICTGVPLDAREQKKRVAEEEVIISR